MPNGGASGSGGSTEVAADESARLRELVGPSEESYAELAEDVVRSQAVAHDAVLEAGRLRARLVELEHELARARRDADRIRRRTGLDGAARLRDLAGEAWTEVIRPTLGDLRRRIRAR